MRNLIVTILRGLAQGLLWLADKLSGPDTVLHGLPQLDDDAPIENLKALYRSWGIERTRVLNALARAHFLPQQLEGLTYTAALQRLTAIRNIGSSGAHQILRCLIRHSR